MYKDTINTNKGIAHLAGKKEIYARIAGTFVKGAGKKIEDLKRFYEQGDFERLIIEIHGLKSSSSTMGSELLPAMCDELEKQGKEGNIDFIRERFDEFIAQYEDTCKALDEAIGKL